jgi:hypothetical protein
MIFKSKLYKLADLRCIMWIKPHEAGDTISFTRIKSVIDVKGY